MDLRNKTFILTGSARIGKNVARMLASKGVNLAVTYLNSKEDAESVVEDSKKIGVKAIAFQADVSKTEDVKKLIDQVKQGFGKIDGLIHMAATYEPTPWATLSEADWDRNINVIAKSAFLLSKAVGDELLKNEGDIKGKIILISDWSVLRSPYKDYLAYNVAKSAIVGLTLSLAKELAPSITVNCIAPGPILEPENLTSGEREEILSKILLKRWGGAEEIAKAVDEALAEGCLLINDMAESQLMGAIRDKNLSAIIFWLKHHHPVYTDKIEIKGKLKHQYNLSSEQEALISKALSMVIGKDKNGK